MRQSDRTRAGPRSCGLRIVRLAGVLLALAWGPSAGIASPARPPAAPPTTPAPTNPVPAPVPEAAASQPGDAAVAASLMISPTAAGRMRRAACAEARRQGEIVVCGADRGEQWRVPSTADSDPTSRQATDNGVARAPGVGSLPDCSRGCVGFGRVPPPVYVVDFTKLPEAPAGSDADRIARGEAPAP